jgi:hypothetical protein
MAAVLPVVPTLALRESALAAVGISATSAGGGALVSGGAGAVFAAKTGVAKVAVIAAATTGTVGGAVVVERKVSNDGDRGATANEVREAPPAAGAAGTTGAVPNPLADTVETSIAKAGFAPPVKEGTKGSGGDGAGADAGAGDELALPFGNHGTSADDKRGFEPVPGQSNGEGARDFAAGQGQGNHNGLHRPHRGREKKAAREQTAREGATGNPNAGPKPKKAKEKPAQAKEKPEHAAGPEKNQAQPAPEPKPGDELVPTLVPPALSGPKDKPEKEPREKPDNGNSDPGSAGASTYLPQ